MLKMSLIVKVSGLNELLASLKNLSELKPVLGDINNEVAQRLVQKMKSKVRVRTGALRDSIKAGDPEDDTLTFSMLHYGLYLELGTSRMPPYPFIQPSIEEVKAEMPEIAREQLLMKPLKKPGVIRFWETSWGALE